MTTPTRNLEELFLRIFKTVILVLMALSLVAVVYFAVTAAFQYGQKPVEPAPAQKAPVKEISIENLKQWLLEQEKRESDTPRPSTGGEQKKSVQFLEEAVKLYRCSESFGRLLGAEIVDSSDAVNQKRIDDLRIKLEEFAFEKPWRGEAWVKAAAAFTCKALEDPAIVALKKEEKIKSVFYPVLNFQLLTWDKIQTERIQFEEREEKRVAIERNLEEIRVETAKAVALTRLLSAGIAFGLFMVLALYLLFAKIENNLRDINEAIKAARPKSSDEVVAG
jgi:hypothetical protein